MDQKGQNPDGQESADRGEGEGELERDSWVNILPPQFEAGESPLLVTWGRFWDNQGEMAVGFYLVGSPMEDKITTLRLAVFGSPASLQDYNPRMAHREFERRIINYNVSDTPVPTVTLNQVHDQLHDYFEAESNQEKLLEHVKEENEEAAEEWFEKFMEEVFPGTDYTYQFRLFLTSPQRLKKNNKAPVAPAEEVDGKIVRVNFVTSPSAGIPCPQLREGMQVYVRIVGQAVEKLPEEMRDSKKKNLSRPLVAWIHKIEENPSLPADFNGEADNYRGVMVELSPGVYGQGLVFKDDMVKIKEQNQQEELFTEELVRVLGLVFLLIIILLLIIFIG